MSRLFSNLEFRQDGLKHRPGSQWGCTALVAGTTVGAGILALPAVTVGAGVIPSTVMLLGVWLYALAAALLIVEVNVQTLCVVGRPGLGLLAMIDSTLGKTMVWTAAVAYLFLHYALLVAYAAQGGDILVTMLQPFVSLSFPTWMGILGFTLPLSSFVCWGRTGWVETFNSILLGLILCSFLGLLLFGMRLADPSQVQLQHWQLAPPAVSVMLVALFYHNVIPVVTTRLEGDIRKIRQSIVVGSAIPLAMFLLWNAVILCCVVPDGLQNSLFDPLMVLQKQYRGDALGDLIAVFSVVAIATSFIGFTYGLLDLFQDLWPTDAPRLSLYGLTLIPTLSLATLNPAIFFTALDYVGTFSITILGGIFPTVMAWKQRQQAPSAPNLLPGGNFSLALMLLCSTAVIAAHLLSSPF
ncbi:MAG: aromatic amino acid transport family protein [Cyanobacteria bacterium P01_A01_bin.17]